MFKIITGPDIEPITLDEFKAQTRYPTGIADPQDDIFNLKIKAARTAIEKVCHIAMIKRTIEIAFPYLPSVLPIEIGPVIEIKSIKYKDADNAEQTLATTAYELDDYHSPAKIIINEVPAISMASALPVKVQVDIGYGETAEDVPADLREAVLIVATKMEAQRINADNILGLVGHIIDNYRTHYGRI